MLKKKEKELKKLIHSLKGREQEPIFEEIKQADRKKLEEVIFEALGLIKMIRKYCLKKLANMYKKEKKNPNLLLLLNQKRILILKPR